MSALESAVPARPRSNFAHFRTNRAGAGARHFTGHRAMRTLRRGLPLCAAALLGACGGAGSDGSTPSAPLASVNLSTSVASVSPPFVLLMSETSVQVSCSVSLTAQSTGTGKGTWVDAVIDFEDLRDTTKSLGTVTLQASDVATAWSQDTISGGLSATSRWKVTGPTAFATTFRMRYQTAGTTRTTSASVHCAPPSATAGTPAPTITALAANPSSGIQAPGTQLRVPFSANTPAGALFSVLHVTGACDQLVPLVHNFETSVSTALGKTLDFPCQLGVPVGVELATIDALGNVDVKSLTTSVTLADSLPPTTWAIFWGRQWLDYLPSPYGEYLAPDTLYAEVDVHDNYKVGAIYLETYPFGVADTLVVKDSVLISDTDCAGPLTCINLFPVVLRPEWAGNKLQFRYYGRDKFGKMSNVYTTISGCVQITASAVNSPNTPNKPYYDPPCVYGAGDPGPDRIPSALRALRADAPIWKPPVRSALFRNALGAGRYDARPVH